MREYPEPVQGSAAGDRFCPAPVVTPDGHRMNAVRFVRVRHVMPQGRVVVDRPLDPDGGVAPFSCAGPVPSTGEPIARKVYSLDLSNPLLPRDQRIEVQLHGPDTRGPRWLGSSGFRGQAQRDLHDVRRGEDAHRGSPEARAVRDHEGHVADSMDPGQDAVGDA